MTAQLLFLMGTPLAIWLCVRTIRRRRRSIADWIAMVVAALWIVLTVSQAVGTWLGGEGPGSSLWKIMAA